MGLLGPNSISLNFSMNLVMIYFSEKGAGVR